MYVLCCANIFLVSDAQFVNVSSLYNENNTLMPPCTFRQYHNCAIEILDGAHDSMLNCSCPTPCDVVLYQTSLSMASASDYDAERFLNSHNMSTFKQKFRFTRDIAQRVNMLIADKDRRTLQEVPKPYH